jgi:hypothetical protein
VAETLLAELCGELALTHVVDPMHAETVTPEQTYYRLHGTSGSRHVHTDASCTGSGTWSTVAPRRTCCSTTSPGR